VQRRGGRANSPLDKPDANGRFSPSNLITILNAQGEIVHQKVGLNQDVQETLRVIKRLIADAN